MSAFDEIKKSRKYKSIDMTQARKNAAQRAREQRMLVLDNIQKDHFLDLDTNSRAWEKIYGYQPNPVQVAPFTLASAVDFEKTLNSINMVDGTTTAAGTPGISSIATFNVAIPGDYFNVPAANRNNNEEYIIAEFPLGVGTDLAFMKPRFPQGEVEVATTFSGFLRFRNEIGGPSGAFNSGFMNNGIIRFKVIDPMAQTTTVILEVSAQQFNAAAEAVSPAGSPRIDYNLKTALYPNFAHSELTTSGSTLQVTISRLWESTVLTADDGTKYDYTTVGDFCIIDGDSSRFYIDTKRLMALDNYQM